MAPCCWCFIRQARTPRACSRRSPAFRSLSVGCVWMCVSLACSGLWLRPDLHLRSWGAECQYCAALDPILDQASELIGSDARILKLDMRGTFAINRDFDVRSAPTMLLFREGVEADRSREDLAAIRDARAIASYVRMHTGPDVLLLRTEEQVREMLLRMQATIDAGSRSTLSGLTHL